MSSDPGLDEFHAALADSALSSKNNFILSHSSLIPLLNESAILPKKDPSAFSSPKNLDIAVFIFPKNVSPALVCPSLNPNTILKSSSNFFNDSLNGFQNLVRSMAPRRTTNTFIWLPKVFPIFDGSSLLATDLDTSPNFFINFSEVLLSEYSFLSYSLLFISYLSFCLENTF